jgi:hypothetical protein
MAEFDEVDVDVDEDLARHLVALGNKRSIILRSYVRACVQHGLTLAAWQRQEPLAPSWPTWYKPAADGGKYWGSVADGDTDFRRCADAYSLALSRARVKRNIALAEQAETILQGAVVDSANAITKLARSARNEMARLNAAKFVLLNRMIATTSSDEDTWDFCEGDVVLAAEAIARQEGRQGDR